MTLEFPSVIFDPTTLMMHIAVVLSNIFLVLWCVSLRIVVIGLTEIHSRIRV